MNVFKLSVELILVLFVSIAFAGPTFGQTKTDRESAGVQLGDTETQFYEFTIRITGKGTASNILATAPIPMDWPEQTVTVVKENTTDNVRKISYKQLTGDARQMVVKVNRLSSGEIAEASVIVRIEKRKLIEPADPKQLQFASKIPASIKQYLRPSPYIESGDQQIKEIAKNLDIDASLPAWEQVEKIYNWVREKLEYKFDPQIHSCMDALKSGRGDCEELSSLFVAVCRAREIPARAVWVSANAVGATTHTYPEFYLTDLEGNGFWIPCQAAGDYQFGTMSEPRPILQKGDRFKLPGHSQPLRYVQPSLIGNAPQGLGFEWTSRLLTDDEVAALEN